MSEAPNKIVRIRVYMTWESCQRTTYYVEVRTDEGFEKIVDAHVTGSVYTDFKGLTKEEARERALIDANTWSDFLNIPVEPYVEDGINYEPTFKFETYTTRRVLNERRAKKAAVE